MKRMILKVGLWLVVWHLLFGALLLVVDAVHGINDQDFGFALFLLFYYLTYSGVWLLKSMGVEFSTVLLVLAGLGQWIVLSVVIGGLAGLFRKKKTGLS